MTQANATGSNANLTATSTPIRIGSYHGSHTTPPAAGAPLNHGSTGNESSSPGGTALTAQQSSSVPSAAGGHMQLQSQNSQNSALSIGASNQSLAVAMGTSSLTPPNSAGLRQTGAFDFKFMRRTSLKVLLPKLSSTDSLSNSPGPASSGIANWATDSRDKYEGNNQADKTPTDTSKLNRKESYKAQRKNYRREKKRVASELLNSLQDPAVIVLADWLKVRGTLKSWTKLWCVVKPGLLLIYKSPKIKSSHWVGTVLLTSCQVIERPSKKDGFCFKLFHPLEQSIWAPRGPDKETIGAVVQPLPTSYLIFRAPSQAAGKCWMDALELSLRCSALLLRSNSNPSATQGATVGDSGQISHETQWSEADYEKHFNEHGTPSARPNTRMSSQSELHKRHHQYLAPPNMEPLSKSLSGSSEISRSQTPILQALYSTMINWERTVANASEFQKIKHFPKLCKASKRAEKGSMKRFSSSGDFCDPFSVNFSPKASLDAHESLKLKKRRLNQFTKSISLGSILNRSSSSDGETDDDVNIVVTPVKSGSERPVSAPPFILTVNDLDADSQNEGAATHMSGIDSDSESERAESPKILDIETHYMPLTEEEFSQQVGEQVEELAEENKSLIWLLVKQVRPGMDLSKVVLPTFILEPRSFLDKLSDSYYHADILSSAVAEDDPFTRMKTVVKWYLSGFYKKPKGLKKPYNPILGETYRCYWEHPNGSRTYYIAEQVSHHPPVSAFYVTNRQDGFCISCSILAKSKFYGNSTSAVLEGVATLTLLPRGESYTLTTPYAHCKGILMGTLSMELGGRINIDCENTGYKTELEFKLKPFLGGSDSTNVVVGKIKLGKETLATINGHWDTEMRIKDIKTNEESVLFTVNQDMKQKRLTRFVVPIQSQLSNESERMWQLVSAAIRRDDQVGATEEKTVLEEAQRTATRERKATFTEWQPMHFQQDIITGQWIYKYADLRPWDTRSDVKQYEADYKVLTKTRHQAPMVRNNSVVSADRVLKAKRRSHSISRASLAAQLSDSSASIDGIINKPISSKSIQKLFLAVDQVNRALDDHTRQLKDIQAKLERIQYAPYTQRAATSTSSLLMYNSLTRCVPSPFLLKTVLYASVGVLICFILKWLFQ